MVLALAKPLDIENSNRYIGAGLLVVVVGLFLHSMVFRKRWREHWDTYRVEFVLIGLLLVGYVGSLVNNLESYGGWFEVLAFGLPPIALGSLFAMAWVLFKGRKDNGEEWPVWALMIGLNLVAIIHAMDYELVRPLVEWTVAADASYPVRHIRSLFRGTTIYGVIAAIIAVYGLGRLWVGRMAGWERALLLLVVITALAGGVLSGSRNFVLTLVAGAIVLAVCSVGRRPLVFLFVGVGLVFAFHAAVWSSPKLAREYGQAFPYLKKLHAPEEMAWKDFVPDLSMRGLAGRPRIWRSTVDFWSESPWIGIGPGVFRLKNDLTTSAGVERVHNTHNIFLQVLVDVGIVGLVLFLILLARILWRVHDPVVLAVVVMLLVSHLFDNYFDKSMAFILIVAWLLSSPTMRLEVRHRNPVSIS